MTHRTGTAALLAALLLFSSAAAQQPQDTLARRQQRSLDSLATLMRILMARVDSLSRRPVGDSAGDDLALIRAAAASAADTANQGATQARLGLSALNPEISVTGDIRATWLRPGPQAEPFEAREYEFAFQSALDPFSVAKIFLAFEDGEVDVEEGYAYYAGLPGHFRVDVGRFRQPVGELNRWHLHALPEGEYPLVLRRFAGDEGLAGTGVSVYWPLPVGGRGGAYELTVQATRGDNPVLFNGGSRPSLLSQLSAFWQISRSTFAQASIAAAVGENPDTSLSTRLVALAGRVTWRPPAEGTRKEVTLRGELWSLQRRYAGTGRARLGGYTDASWRLGRRWIAAMRGDWIENPDGPGHEWAITPTLTFWQSEFVYLRAQFSHQQDAAKRDTERLSLQIVFAMGPHKHELF